MAAAASPTAAAHCHTGGDPFADLFELMICTGMRKGEVLGLHWADVDLDARLLFVRWTLVSVDNSRSMFNAPKTHGSRAWVALSARAVDALQRQRRRQQQFASTDYDDLDLAFARRGPVWASHPRRRCRG